jgi:hypothetical protein
MLSFGHAKDWTLAKYHGFRKQTRWFWLWTSEIGGQARMGLQKSNYMCFQPRLVYHPLESCVLTRIKWFMVWDNKKNQGVKAGRKLSI